MTTYMRSGEDGTVLERSTPEPGGVLDRDLAAAALDDASPWSVDPDDQPASTDGVEGSTTPLADNVDQSASSVPAPPGRTPRGPRGGGSSSSSGDGSGDSSGDSSGEG